MFLSLDVSLGSECLVNPFVDAHQAASHIARFDRRSHLFSRCAGRFKILDQQILDGLSGFLLRWTEFLVARFLLRVDFYSRTVAHVLIDVNRHRGVELLLALPANE